MLCPSQFGANGQEDNQHTDSVMWIDELIMGNEQIEEEFRLSVYVGGTWLVQKEEYLKEDNRLTDAVTASLSWCWTTIRRRTDTSSQI